MNEVRRVEWGLPFQGDLGEPASAEHPHVHLILPSGFDRYVRVFHPYVDRQSDASDRLPKRRGPRWKELAETAGVPFGPTLTSRQLEGALPGTDWSDCPWALWEGELEEAAANALFGALAPHTRCPVRFQFGLWAIILGADHEPITFEATSLTARHQVIEAARSAGVRNVTTAEYVWPVDQSWVVMTDYDLVSTYVALSNEAADDLLDSTALETVEVKLTTRIDRAADEQS